METYPIEHITDYIIFRLKSEDDTNLSNLKLQKLLYYTQAWHLAFFGRPLFDGKFQAWIHGPVNREVFDRFKADKTLYSAIGVEDMKNPGIADLITDTDTIIHIDNVLEGYAQFSGVELEVLSHGEEPWIKARKGYSQHARCEVEIDESVMEAYYKQRVND